MNPFRAAIQRICEATAGEARATEEAERIVGGAAGARTRMAIATSAPADQERLASALTRMAALLRRRAAACDQLLAMIDERRKQRES